MKRIIEHTRGYANAADRKRAIAMLAKQGWNYFICFRDVQSDFALAYNKADWVTPGGIHVSR